jgi:hypothetical protein
MAYPHIGFGLGVMSVALGAFELLASRRIARRLSAEGHEGLIRAFGAREVVTGASLLKAPSHSAWVWNRVAGDAADLAALAMAARRAPSNREIWTSAAFVVSATLLDVVTALGLGRQTGRLIPRKAGASAKKPRSTRRISNTDHGRTLRRRIANA